MGVFERTSQFGIGCLACVLYAAGCSSQPDFADSPMHSDVDLVSDMTGLSPATTSMLAFVFEIDNGWHTYADSINDSGSPLLIFWALPDGVEIGDPIWPASHRYVQAGGVLDHVYEDKLVVMLPVTTSSDAEVGVDAVISASLEWLVCDDSICVPQFDEVSISLPILNSASQSKDAEIINTARKNSGKLFTGARNDKIVADWEGDTLVMTNTLGLEMSFIPGPGCVKPLELLTQGHSETGEIELKFDFDDNPNEYVMGWVRLHAIEGQNTTQIEDDLYLIHLRRGNKPTLILDG
jgi:DsbC/DsbD-like thiol-disulfide interchange protein